MCYFPFPISPQQTWEAGIIFLKSKLILMVSAGNLYVFTLYPFEELNPEPAIRCYHQIQEEMLIFESQEA